MLIDAHHHVWDRARHPMPWIDPVSMARIDADFTVDDMPLAACGVDGTVVVQARSHPDETADLLALAADDPRVRGVVGWVDLRGDDVGAVLDALRAGPGGAALVGVRATLQDDDADAPDDPRVHAGVRAVAARGLTVDLLVRTHQLASSARTAHALPHVPFVLDHLAKPDLRPGGDLDAWRRGLRALAAAPNVVAKLSGLVTEATWDTWTVDDLRPAADVALDAFGPERLMWGSDWPVCTLASGYARWLDAARELTADLSAAQRAAVEHGTAVAAYGLALTPTARRGTPTHEERS